MTSTRDDLQDLFPGPKNFLQRKAVWRPCHGASEEVSSSVKWFNLTAYLSWKQLIELTAQHVSSVQFRLIDEGEESH